MADEHEDIETTPDAEEESQVQTVIPDDGSEVVDKTIDIGAETPSIEKEVAEFEKEAGDGIEEVPEETPGEKETPSEEAEERGEKIPDEFATAAKAVNWNDEQIVDFVSKNDYSDEQLIEMIPHLKAQEKEEPQKPAKEEPAQKPAAEPAAPPVKVDADTAAKINAYIDAQLKEKTDSLEKRLSQVQDDSSMKELVQFENTANDFFDRMSSDQIGKTKELPKFPDGRYVPTDPRFKARSQMYDMALLLASKGQPFDKALMNAAAWYRGLHLEKETERKVIKRLKGNQKRLSPQRYNKITETKYTSEEDRRADVVKGAADEAGLKKFD